MSTSKTSKTKQCPTCGGGGWFAGGMAGEILCRTCNGTGKVKR